MTMISLKEMWNTTLCCIWGTQSDMLKVKNNTLFTLTKVSCLIGYIVKWKVHGPRYKNIWVLQFSDLMLKSERKTKNPPGTEKCV